MSKGWVKILDCIWEEEDFTVGLSAVEGPRKGLTSTSFPLTG
jgi:hypothetical protein